MSGKYIVENVKFLLKTFCCEPTNDFDYDSSSLEIAVSYRNESYIYALQYLNMYMEFGGNFIESMDDVR